MYSRVGTKMIFRVSFLLAALTASLQLVRGKSLPNFVNICRRSDPEVDKCILKSIETVKPHLKKGIPELGIPPVEPLFIPHLGVPGNNGENVVLGTNISIYGASNFNVETFRVDLSNPSRPTFHLKLNIPRLRFEGQYEVNARILAFPLKGKGPIQFNATDTRVDAVLYGQVYKKGTHNYMRFIRMDMSLKMNDYNLRLSNLFNGDKLLEEATNQALNENKNEFKQALNPTVTQYVTELVLDFANRIAKNHAYDELFPN